MKGWIEILVTGKKVWLNPWENILIMGKYINYGTVLMIFDLIFNWF